MFLKGSFASFTRPRAHTTIGPDDACARRGGRARAAPRAPLLPHCRGGRGMGPRGAPPPGTPGARPPSHRCNGARSQRRVTQPDRARRPASHAAPAARSDRPPARRPRPGRRHGVDLGTRHAQPRLGPHDTEPRCRRPHGSPAVGRGDRPRAVRRARVRGRAVAGVGRSEQRPGYVGRGVPRARPERAAHRRPRVVDDAAMYEGMVLERSGDVQRAIEVLSSVSARAAAQGYYDIAATASGATGQIWLRLGDIERGLEATSIDLPNLQPFPRAYLATARGTLLERRGRLDEAEATLLAATQAAAEVPNPVLEAEAREALGRLYASRGDLLRADSALLMAIALYTHAGRTAEAMKVLRTAIRRVTQTGLGSPLLPRLSPEGT